MATFMEDPALDASVFRYAQTVGKQLGEKISYGKALGGPDYMWNKPYDRLSLQEKKAVDQTGRDLRQKAITLAVKEQADRYGQIQKDEDELRKMQLAKARMEMQRMQQG